MKYEVVIYWSDEDQVFIAEVPELPGCMTHGQSYQQASSNAEEAMRGWLKAWAELGREAPAPRQHVLAS